MAPPEIRIGLIGYGTVGRTFAEAFAQRCEGLEHASRARLTLSQIAVRRTPSDNASIQTRSLSARLHNDAAGLAADPSIDLIVEASGAGEAAAWITTALARGAAVVTANKRALATHPGLLAVLASRQPGLYCEASVAAGIPIVRALRDSLEGEDVRRIRGVLNGTSTYVLSAIEHGLTFDGALAKAQRLGFAECDPQLDLSGADAAHKLAILCSIAWNEPLPVDRIVVEGIDGCIEQTARLARIRNARVRLVACAQRAPVLTASVRPEVLAQADPLSAATDVVNVVEVDAALAGVLRWTGPGAGGPATASALLADTLAAARWLAPCRAHQAAA
ncbi:MAG: homoserine dehydrogenase [Gemmatimonadaceae bacterium]